MEDQDPVNQIKQALLTADIELRNLPEYNEVVDSSIAAARSAINAATAFVTNPDLKDGDSLV